MITEFKILAAAILPAAVPAGLGQPTITQQAQSCTNVVGTTATFTVGATGTEPLAYQWQKSTGAWIDLTNSTDTHLRLTNAQTTDAADYRVVVTNVEAAVTSSVAHLYVLSPATLRFSLATCTVAENGGTVILTV